MVSLLTFNMAYFLAQFPKLMAVIPYTLYIICVSALICLSLGTLIAAVRIARVPVLAHFCEVWLSFIRSMPFILELYLTYFCLPVVLRLAGVNTAGWPLTVYVFVSIAFHYSPMISEVIRPAYYAVDRGQHEAAMVFGLSAYKRIRRIIAPQALPIALPGLVNQLIDMIKDTSLMFLIGVIDLMGKAGLIINSNYGRGKLEVYVAVAVLYWAFVIVLEFLMHYLERRNLRSLSREG